MSTVQKRCPVNHAGLREPIPSQAPASVAPRCLRAAGRPKHLLPTALLALFCLLPSLPAPAATLLVWPDSPNPTAPHADWARAARTIQAAVDAAQPGDTILVTNGVYATGGRAVFGLMTNRVAVDKAVRVQSVNGPEVTVIQGHQVSGTTNGDGAIRCIYLATGAVLSGFTLTNGATRGAGDTTCEKSGGGIWCASTNSVVTNCLVTGNWAAASGGGAYAGTLQNCTLTGNWAQLGGGGACNGTRNNCFVAANSASGPGGGVYNDTLNNCTLTRNSATSAGGAYLGTLNNSILYDNQAATGPNYSGSTLNYCCTTPAPATGTGNIARDPQLAGFHLNVSSPCRGAGSVAYTTGLDLDGQAWLNPPPIGCDEYHAESGTGPLTTAISVSWTNIAPGFAVDLIALITGSATASEWDFGDGMVLSNQFSTRHAWAAAGEHTVVLRAYNDSHPEGVSAAVTIRVSAAVHYVASASLNALPPYSSWDTAARTIQEAVDTVKMAGALVLVSNGVYATGGRAVSGTMTNRVAVTKPVVVRSVSGPEATSIQGYQVPAMTNGEGAIRCVYLSDGAVLSGFTLTGGATLANEGTDDVEQAARQESGGGVWCESLTAEVSNCILRGNSAANGGGARGGTLNNCTLAGNWASNGGGAYQSVLNNCVLTGNSASSAGGGASSGILNHCTVTANSASAGGGARASTLNNCILYYNSAVEGPNYSASSLSYCCTTPDPGTGIGNIVVEPQLASVSHVSAGSPCRAAGLPASATGWDIDGEGWLSPPSIGCDEYRADTATGNLTVAIGTSRTETSAGNPIDLSAWIGGRATSSAWDFGDGAVLRNRPCTSHTWDAAGDYHVTLRAFNQSHPGGLSATVTIRVVLHHVAAASTNPLPPFCSWETAARTIQEAVDVTSGPGALVMVTNGVYASGGRAVAGTLTNRLTVDKPVRVQSVNGPEVTVIQGYQVPATTNGDGAIRCVYLTNGAVLSGFFLTKGATRTSGDAIQEQSGGGVWCESSDALVTNCILAGNSAVNGGGAFGGRLNNCLFTGNSAWNGGGAYQATLNNCALAGNGVTYAGGGACLGTLHNCTLTGNSASVSGGGTYSAALNNCIVYYNTPGSNYAGGTLDYCCTTPGPTSGTGNLTAEPQLASASHLSAGSPCRGAGATTVANGADIDGEAWLQPPSIGCDEYAETTSTGLLTVTIGAARTNVPVGFATDLTGQISGRLTASAWEFGDGTVLSNRPYTSHTWTTPGEYAVVLRAYNQSYPEGFSATVTILVTPPVYYVALDSANPIWPFSSWGTAARTIQEAVDAVTMPGALVLVSNGVYATGGRPVYGPMTNRVTVDKPLRLQSVNGPEVTVIEGYQVPGPAVGLGAIRCVHLADGAVVSGFTLTHGATLYWGDTTEGQSGGGVWCASTNALITNCIFTGNASALNGGAVYQGSLHHCTFTGNWAYYGGATYGSVLNECNLIQNSARQGGGSWASTLNGCTITANSAGKAGGGASQGTLNHCVLAGNFVTETSGAGGGASSATLNNCALTGNSAPNGGGADHCALTHCTLTGNSAGLSGGGAFCGTLNNCILYDNMADNGANYHGPATVENDTITLNYCCTTPLPTNGLGNLSADPQLASASHLSAGSPCRGAGQATDSMGVDLDGEHWLTPPSIGCDEYQAGAVTGAVTIALSASKTNVAVGFAVDLLADLGGRLTASVWDFGDGTTLSNRPHARHAWTTPGDYTVVLRAYNESFPDGVSAALAIRVVTLAHHVTATSANPVPPYSSWETAARTIQDAVEAATVPGALIWVTNGIYATGGQAVDGLMTNRVAVTKPVRVQSVNGPEVTVIEGSQVPGTTNGDGAIRCVYLTNGAVLSGFTLTQGATRTSGDAAQEQSGGGVWCASVAAQVTNCVFTGNAAPNGGGARSGTLHNCTFIGNSAWNGGAAYSATLNNCLLTGNRVSYSGGGACYGTLNNCTVTRNAAARTGGGAYSSALNNCILYYNEAASEANFSGSTLNYCCTTPVPGTGSGNITAEPALASIGRLSVDSPCRGVGSAALANGVDLDGESWLVPPSMGCDEYQAGTLTGPLTVVIEAAWTNVPVGLAVPLTGRIKGRVTGSAWDFGDGTTLSNRAEITHAWTTPGDYTVVLWAWNETYSNGVSAALTVRVGAPQHYVAINSSNPMPPYSSWATAARTIQEAVEAATLPGALVLVTNGVYATGGRAIYGLMTNRVAVTKPLTVQSANGPEVTVIQGFQVPGTTNGDGAIRCVYLTNGAVLSGFTLTKGATRTSGNAIQEQSGGGVWCVSANARVTNCLFTGNAAPNGGGARSGTLHNCVFTGNWAWNGGGAYSATLNNCTLTGNGVSYAGGAVCYGTLSHCTLTGNLAQSGGGAYSATLNNCLLYYNTAPSGPNYNSGSLSYCCTTPDPGSGAGNITLEPRLASASHLSAGSPCRGAGSSASATGVDLDGEAWLNPPSIGCDEYWAGAVTGLLAVTIQVPRTDVPVGVALDLTGRIGGRVAASAWDFGDGAFLSNRPFASHAWAAPGTYTVVLRAYNESFPEGVSGTVTLRVGAHCVSAVSANPAPPYTSWETAARTIQDAVDVAQAGDTILVTNGLYATGGRAVSGLMTNRVAVDKPLIVLSLNGPAVTVIQGYQVPDTTNGDGAIRCVYLTSGAVLSGFALTQGATRTSGDPTREQCGGGVWCESFGALVTNCTLRGNTAREGGGAYQGTLDNCLLSGNFSSRGGGAFAATLHNCALLGNRASSQGGGAWDGTLHNCTLTGNAAEVGGGACSATLNNCLLYYNIAASGSNHHQSTLNYCCTTPDPGSGTGNLTAEPQLASASRLSASSPCRGAGGADYAAGVDLDGESWLNPPAIGCDEYRADSAPGPFTVAIRVASTNVVVGTALDLTGWIDGPVSTSGWDFGDGTVLSNRPYTSHAWTSVGNYVVVLRAYNESHPEGMSAMVGVQVKPHPVHYVAAGSTDPVPPFISWATAARSIQEAVDVAAPGTRVLVTNGLYASGGRAVDGAMTNRVAVTQPITIQSVNGPEATVIQGSHAPGATNGDGAVRCAYLADRAVLSGFTLTHGATRATGDTTLEQSGGGVWCVSTNAHVTNCLFLANGAARSGGGAYSGTLWNCVLTGNWAQFAGGGACNGTCHNSVFTANSTAGTGGGVANDVLHNCTLTGNSAVYAGGAYQGTLHNCLLYYNAALAGPNYAESILNYCCTTPGPGSGTGNITAEPELASAFHLSVSSPCRGVGSGAYATGVDIDQEPWLSPPSIGCDEYRTGAGTGPLAVAIGVSQTYVRVGSAVDLAATISGRVTASVWELGDGTFLTNRPYASHAWNVPGDYSVVLRAYNESFPDGVSTTATIRVRAQLVHYVAAGNAKATPPYFSWETAAQTLQDAVDVAGPGALVLVSNGVYAAGGRAVFGTMTNRVAVTKPVTVRSVNGPEVTHIQGCQVPGTTNGDGAIRCVYLADGAVLSGFTLTNGATHCSGDANREESGGGVWCESLNAVVTNCTLTGNAAANGGGAYSGTLNNCVFTGNSAWNGGGAYQATLNNCGLAGNWVSYAGGAACYGTLDHCTLTGNSAQSGGGAYAATLDNCVLYYNAARDGPNYNGGNLNYCCTTPLPGRGSGNIIVEPQLADALHLSPGSPCRVAGNAASVSGTDLDGEPWLNPPSIGCDEYQGGAITGPLAVAILASRTNVTVGVAVDLTAVVSGRTGASGWDFGDGTVLSNRPYASHAWGRVGDYAVVLRAYNASFPDGVSALITIRVVAQPVHYVAVASVNPVPPYASWETAARTLQEAVDVAAPGALVLATNGFYVTGGRAVYGTMTNRVVVDKPVTVRSVNGPEVTVIQGCRLPEITNGDGAMRCVYLTNGAVLSGFTLTDGATRSSGDATREQSGGGVWCESLDAVVTNCTLTGNSALNGGGVYSGTLHDCIVTLNSARNGGGVSQAALNHCTLSLNSAQFGGGTDGGMVNNCTLTANSAERGGGAFSSALNNCSLTGNSAQVGGGTEGGTLNNCTLTGNSAAEQGGGAYNGTLNNGLLYYNRANDGSNYYGSTLNYCCTTPAPSGGLGNITTEPQLADASHLSAVSPCRGAGSTNYSSGLDTDGEPWLTPPSIGCDEYRSGSVTGPLTLAIESSWTNVPVGFAVDLTGLVSGRTMASVWDFGDGTVLSNRPYASHAWDAVGDYAVVFRAYNESDPDGVSATLPIRVVARPVHYVAADSVNPVPPYASWETAARTLQEAVDLAVPGALVLVTNGLYATGGRAVDGAMTNRVAVTKSLTVQSVNGPEVTVIQGYQVPGSIVGDGAIRCVYLTRGAILDGFTLTNGATCASPGRWHECRGGGLWCQSQDALITNCTLTGNTSALEGGGAFGGTLNHCTLLGNTTFWSGGGGAAFATLTDCTLMGNSASDSDGGGAYSSTLNNCLLTANTTTGVDSSGGGAAYATLNNCTLTGNLAALHGGGACYGTLNNCALIGNSAYDAGGGAFWSTLNHCTLTGNSAAARGGGTCDGTLSDCIVYYNTANDGPNYSWSTINFSCTTPLPGSGMGNITVEPRLASASHLSASSPCRGAGSLGDTTGSDIDGEPWLSPPSMGCDEYRLGAVTGPLSVAIRSSLTNVAVGWAIDLTGWIGGRTVASVWDFGDGTVVSNRPYVTHAWSVAGDYPVVLRAYNETYPEGVSATLTVRVRASVYYVSAGSAQPVPPYDSWNTAARTLQEAVDVAAPGTLILVSNGVYASGGRAVRGTMTNRVAVDRPVLVRSVNGPEMTIIQGSQVPDTTNGDGAIRCVYLTNGAVLSGFTLANGATRASGDTTVERSGGGVWCGSIASLVTNCAITGNWAAASGGGAYSGTLKNCTLTGNWARLGGGGACNGLRSHCVFTANSSSGPGGGAYNDTLNNCTLTGNSAASAGGAYQGTLNNCILYYNSAPDAPDSSGGTLNHCCTTPLPTTGTGNVADDPLFVDPFGGNWRLQSNSPCINAGANAYVADGSDLDGLPRIAGGTVDIGAYEFQAPASAISYAWLRQFGLPTDSSADFADPDGDSLTTWEEWVCGTGPTDALSALRLLPPSNGLAGVTLTWESVSTRFYFLERATNLAVQPRFLPLAAGLLGQPGTTSYTDTNAPVAGPVFYRVGIRASP